METLKFNHNNGTKFREHIFKQFASWKIHAICNTTANKINSTVPLSNV